MFAIRRSQDRGYFNHGWLKTYHSFSFGEYQDQKHLNYGVLRVINQDSIAPKMGFATHPHRNMEILTWMISGQLTHQDSLGNQISLAAGEVQRITAGAGLTHSEMNASANESVELLQIWIEPHTQGLAPSYEQKAFPGEGRQSKLQLIVGPESVKGSLTWHQNAFLYASILGEDDVLEHHFKPSRTGYIHVISGSIIADGHLLRAGDGAKMSHLKKVSMGTPQRGEFLLFDLP